MSVEGEGLWTIPPPLKIWDFEDFTSFFTQDQKRGTPVSSPRTETLKFQQFWTQGQTEDRNPLPPKWDFEILVLDTGSKRRNPSHPKYGTFGVRGDHFEPQFIDTWC